MHTNNNAAAHSTFNALMDMQNPMLTEGNGIVKKATYMSASNQNTY